MHIIKGTEPIEVEHPVFLLFGQPGICKSSLAYSAKDPLLLDFDEGAHRAANRRDTLHVGTWADIDELMESQDALAPYQTLIPDTVGRCLDLMIADIIEQNPKYARDGSLTQQGWGVLKSRFRTWMTRLRAMGKDVLLIAHQREDKDGDVTIVRPDIVGGSYGEVLKIADFVGFLYMRGRDRVLDFSPSDRWTGKNPGGWKPFVVPPVAKAQHFMAEVFDQGRAALGAISEESAVMTRQVETWRTTITEAPATAHAFNQMMPMIKAIQSPIIQAQAAKLLLDIGEARGVIFDKRARQFTGQATPAPPATLVEQPAAEPAEPALIHNMRDHQFDEPRLEHAGAPVAGSLV